MVLNDLIFNLAFIANHRADCGWAEASASRWMRFDATCSVSLPPRSLNWNGACESHRRHHQRRWWPERNAAGPTSAAFDTVDNKIPWLRRGHGTACRDLSHRHLHWRPLDVSWRRNCSLEVFLISTALPMIASDRYSVLTLRHTRVLSLFLAFLRCPYSLLTLRHLNLFFL